MEGNTHAVRVPPCLDFLCLDGINADIYGGDIIGERLCVLDGIDDRLLHIRYRNDDRVVREFVCLGQALFERKLLGDGEVVLVYLAGQKHKTWYGDEHDPCAVGKLFGCNDNKYDCSNYRADAVYKHPFTPAFSFIGNPVFDHTCLGKGKGSENADSIEWNQGVSISSK